MLNFLTRAKSIPKLREVVIDENDIEDVINHLHSLPYVPPYHKSWDREKIISRIRIEIGRNPKAGECHYIAPGVYAIMEYAGSDRVHYGQAPESDILEVRLAIRRGGGRSIPIR